MSDLGLLLFAVWNSLYGFFMCVFLLCFLVFAAGMASSMVVAWLDNDNFTFPLDNKAPE